MDTQIAQTTSESSPETLRSLRNVVLILYILYLSTIFTGFLSLIVAMVVGHVKKADAQGTIYHSHFRWILKTCWIGIAGSVVATSIMAFLVMGMFAKGYSYWAPLFIIGCLGALLCIMVWSAYRIVKGMVRWMDRKAVV